MGIGGPLGPGRPDREAAGPGVRTERAGADERTGGAADAGRGAGRSPSRRPRTRVEPDEAGAWAVLASVPGVGPVSFARLVERFGSAGSVLESATARGGPAALVAATAGPDGERPTLSIPGAEAVALAAAAGPRLIAQLSRSGVRPLPLVDPAYPSRLRRIELPPPVLFVAGDVGALESASPVAIVGTRRPSAAGRDVTIRIASALAATGTTVVSGLAYGIDGAAHAAAVRAGRPTVAVIGGGHDHLTPRAHAGLGRAIASGGGAIVSEFPPEVAPSRGTFPRRNRIISGLADATVVVEAGLRSGALTTAAWALEQGRDLYLVPGSIDAPTAAGCLAFLRELAPEARIVAGIPELLEDLGRTGAGPGAATAGVRPSEMGGPRTTGPHDLLAPLGHVASAVGAQVVAGASSVDELVVATGLAPATVLGALTVLEIRGLVIPDFGRFRPAGALAAAGRPVSGRGSRLRGRPVAG